jgi:hypothetical protein
MPIEDPLDASEQAIADEQRSESPLSRFVPNLAQLASIIPSTGIPFVELAKSALRGAGFWISKQEASRREYLIECLSDELRRVRGKLESLEESYQRFVRDECFPLVLDGLQKAEQTPNRNRIRRIAAILAHAFELGPAKSGETAEEMMRIAMLLSDDDVVVLRALYEGQKAHYNPHLGMTAYEQINDFWRLLDGSVMPNGEPEIPTLRRFPVGQVQGICAKLQSLGLVVQVERNKLKVSNGTIPYGILANAVKFVEYIQSSE